MTLAFPNHSRSFDKARNAVRFAGHDGMFEIPFLVEMGALGASSAAAHLTGLEEDACLSAFDRRRNAVHAAASKVYAGGPRRPYYVLTAADIR
ncbi:DUF1488 family protein [Ancylobacter lacus]|uniref:DUF1488 family protein n=1 Tax=Ancylobacter lacus TaxID=2579970 RepID=UPI001BD0BB8D|nr:DUF1488 family protein [Ancylobacter lacus]MBS7539565.1 DUF1488 family protein [Ancylobacter lacus]